ncbi:4-oxalocrotonate tautomerase [Aureobasidium namibiae CBS 147.97]|uniref:4-oxalocrotonate tautomerase n=1 Tax=Aureobasidium namibiae CBS 147.97 TaxID=1043004 RepID=A0A074W909_9PEZI
MPLVKIDVIKNVRTLGEIQHLADVIQTVLLNTFAAPPRDRYQIITQHEPYEMIFEDTGLSIPRTEKLVLIQIFQQGRSTEQKQAFYAALAERLGKECCVPKTDLVVTVSANTKDDWSFGLGRAQFVTGDL